MIKSAIQQKTVGNLLREKRKERKLSIEQIAEITKIRSEYLHALEESDYGVFPSEVYLKGFLKNYAKYLGISSEQALALFRRENIIKVGKVKPNLLDKLKERSKKIVITPNKIIILVAAILLISVVLYLSSYIGKVLKKPGLTLTSPVSVTTEGEYTFTTDKDTFELSGTSDVAAKISVNGQDLGPATMTSFAKTFPLTNSSDKFIIKAVSPFGRETSLTLTVIKSNFVDPSITTTPATVQINAVVDVLADNTGLTVYIDGVMTTDKFYKKGNKLEFTAGDQLSISINKVGSISLTINGVHEEVTGKSIVFELIDGKILKK